MNRPDKNTLKVSEPNLQVEMVRIPTFGVPFMKISSHCIGIKETVPQRTIPSSLSFPGNRKFLRGKKVSPNKFVEAYHIQSNQSYPSDHRCVGYQIIFVMFNVNRNEMNEIELKKYKQLCNEMIGCMPVNKGARTILLITKPHTAEQFQLQQEMEGKKKAEILKPLDAPYFLFKKTLDILNLYRDNNGNFNANDLKQRSKDWLNDHLKFHYNNFNTFKPAELVTQMLKQMVKNIQDIIKKKE